MSSLERNRAALLGALCAALFAASVAAGLRARMHQTLPEAVGRHTLSMSVAVSRLRHGLKGYLAYNDVVRILSKVGEDRSAMTDPAKLNAFIAQAAAAPAPAASGTCPLVREDKGLIVYYMLAFVLFGYRVQSLFWLYFALLGASALAWTLAFRRRPELMALLALFLGAHLAAVLAAPAVGIELAAVHNPRFLPVLAIPAALHLALLVLGKHRLEPSVFAGAAAQAGLLMLVIHTRSGTITQVLFLAALLGAAALLRLRRQPELGALVFSAVRPWPVALAVAGVLLLKMHVHWSLGREYAASTARHLFWHPAYLGLAVHPEAQRRFGFRFSDDVAFETGRRVALERFGKDLSQVDDWAVYEAALKSEYLRLAREAPVLTVRNYLYKFRLFARTMLVQPYGAGRRLLWLLPLALAVSWLAGPLFARHWPELAALTALCWGFSMVPAVIATPDPHLIAEPATLLIVAALTAAGGAGARLWAR